MNTMNLHNVTAVRVRPGQGSSSSTRWVSLLITADGREFELTMFEYDYGTRLLESLAAQFAQIAPVEVVS